MKIFTGKVISTKMKNTATVVVSGSHMHRLYGKRFARSKKYHVHDEYDKKVGEVVNFVASRPYSKIVKWKMIDLKATEKKALTEKKKTVKISETGRGSVKIKK